MPRAKKQEPAAVLPGQIPVPLTASPHCCEEASTLSGATYIPCNRPAVSIVAWTGRNDKAIRMCAMCADHNVRNRGGYIVQPYAAPKQTEFPVRPNIDGTPGVGSNSDVTDEALIAENFKLEDLIAAAAAKLNEWAKPHKARIAEIEGILRVRLSERKADSTKTDAGTAYFSHLMNTKVEDTGTLFDFVADRWEELGPDAKISVPLAAVKDHMEKNEGKPPPGMSVSYFTRLNIKRS